MDFYGHWQLPLILFEIALAIGVSALVFGVLFPAPGSERYIARQQAKQANKMPLPSVPAMAAPTWEKGDQTLADVQAQSGPSLTYRVGEKWGSGVGSSLAPADLQSTILIDESSGVRTFIDNGAYIGIGFVTLKRDGDGMPIDSAIAVQPEPEPKPRRVPDGTRDLDIDL